MKINRTQAQHNAAGHCAIISTLPSSPSSLSSAAASFGNNEIVDSVLYLYA